MADFWVTPLMFLSAIGGTFHVPTAFAESLYDFTSTTTVRDYVVAQASTTPDLAEFVAGNESGFVYNQRGDLNLTCLNTDSPYYGRKVYARGVWQITRCYHPEISDAQADDVIWSTIWAVSRLKNKKLCMQEWTQCRLYYKGNVNSSK